MENRDWWLGEHPCESSGIPLPGMAQRYWWAISYLSGHWIGPWVYQPNLVLSLLWLPRMQPWLHIQQQSLHLLKYQSTVCQRDWYQPGFRSLRKTEIKDLICLRIRRRAAIGWDKSPFHAHKLILSSDISKSLTLFRINEIRIVQRETKSRFPTTNQDCMYNVSEYTAQLRPFL